MRPETITKAVALLRERTGLDLTLQKGRDGLPHVVLKAPNVRTRKFPIEYRKYVHNNQTLGPTLAALRQETPPKLLVAEYINPTSAERLRELNIPFLDAAGNAFLDVPPVYLFIVGNKPREAPGREAPKAFHAAALKVLFPLLCRPELVNATLRELARYAGVALGTVKNVLDDLRRRKHLVVTPDGRPHLVNMKPLLQEWVLLYPKVLRPKMLIGRYAAPQHDWWQHAKLRNEDKWGGEIGAALLTQYLKPQLGTIYTHWEVPPILVRNRLKEAPNGTVEILRAFWEADLFNEDEKGKRGVAPALLIYADLLATAEPRNIEAAQILYDQTLARHLS